MDEFVGGHVALDFVNTAGGATRERDTERLPTWDAVLSWCRAAGLVEAEVPPPADPDAALARLHGLREDLHAFLTTGRGGPRVAPAVAEAYGRSTLDPSLGWTVSVAGHGPDVPALRITLAIGTLLAGGELARVAQCGRCSWLFLDPSPTRRRRWCSMATCGNRAKAERHHLRQRQ